MKKIIILVIAITVLISVNFVLAKDQPSGKPFQAIWDAIDFLQEQIDNISGSSGESDWDEERIVELENNISDLWDEINQIQNRECMPGNTEPCDTGLLGICSAGTKTCNQDWFWGECIQNQQPTEEIYDDLDNDCDGVIDNDIDGIVEDDFNAYLDGSIVGQGNWNSYVNGENFIVQGATIFEGAKALYNKTQGNSVITKGGTPLSDGRQVFYIRTENRSSWGVGSFVQVRATKGPWASGSLNLSFCSISFEKDGNVGYWDGSEYKNFATYNDNEWTKLEINWRSSDNKARYKINSGIWTDWDVFEYSAYFTDFDYVGFDFRLAGGSGGIYFDDLY